MPRLRLDPTAPFGVSVAPEVRVERQSNGYVEKIQRLNELQDVVIEGTPLDDQALAYDSATNKFIPQTISGGTGGTNATNLTTATTTTNVTVASDTGTDAIIAASTSTAAGVMTSADRTKLDGVATGATANSTDTFLLARGNHTGTQAVSTITGLATVATSGSYNDLLNRPDLSALNDVQSYINLAGFPATGSTGHVYIAEDTGYMYRWNGTSYTQLTDQTAIWGQVSGTLANQTDLNTALNSKEASITAGTLSQYYRGDKTFQTLNKTAVGLANVDNTSDTAKPVSTAQQTALDAKLNASVISANGKGTARHLADANFPRPTGFASIEWVGSVEPTNATTADTWIDTA